MGETRRFGWPDGWRIRATIDDQHVTVRGALLTARARVERSAVCRAGIDQRSVGFRSNRFLVLYGANGEALGMTKVFGMPGKAERAVAWINERVRGASPGTG
jgi:hypothetical protein